MTNVERLIEALRGWVETTNAKLRGNEPEDLAFAERYGQPLADVRVFAPLDSHNDKKVVVLAFDGAGYDFLSPESDYPSVADRYEREIAALVEPLGFCLEYENNWSMGFYPR